MVLDYSEIAQRELHYRLATTEPSEITGHIYNENFGWCPYHNKEIKLVFDEYDPLDSPHDGGEHLKIWACDHCGFWQADRISTWWNDLATLEGRNRRQKHSILRQFDIGSNGLPVNTLKSYLKSRPKTVYDISSRNMEMLVKSVFSDFFNCEVQHCGKSHDGGVDLYFIESDKPTFVQVKRRKSPTQTESVAQIREFLGALMLKDAKQGYFVSTADHFSEQAKHAAKSAETKGLVESYNLINYEGFFDMLNIVYKEQDPPWTKYVKEYLNLIKSRRN